jgi:hypothetical protein
MADAQRLRFLALGITSRLGSNGRNVIMGHGLEISNELAALSRMVYLFHFETQSCRLAGAFQGMLYRRNEISDPQHLLGLPLPACEENKFYCFSTLMPTV